MWSLAYQLFRDHRPDQDGFCVTCVPSEFSPCCGRHLAVRGFLTSCRMSGPTPTRELR
ncbi:hypothetical protein FHX34_104306 [Actinoplanes teichomyceticus]|uniref:Uncharacterized protein n=1 Tax=Actinoplanes teichomyceticus TaxID=1867 RepID=A0A561VQW8_ACTTI|nr:hypothetical protein FHX34_104306 [Actinoplanes teichomyceticus]